MDGRRDSEWMDDGGMNDGERESGREGEEVEGKRKMNRWAPTIDRLHIRY